MSRPVKAASVRLTVRVKVGLSDDDKAWLEKKALEAGMDESRYMRSLLLAERGKGAPPRPRKFRASDEIMHAVNKTYVQVKKLGTNVNQLAHQANAGMVAVTRSEVVYLMNAVQTTMSQVRGTMEKLVA